MTTVAQLIEKLKTYPSDMEVECLVSSTSAGYRYDDWLPLDLKYDHLKKHDYTFRKMSETVLRIGQIR